MADQPKDYPNFEEVWGRIVAHAGETFHAHDGHEFTYKIDGDRFVADKPHQEINKSNFETAYKMVPIHRDALNEKIVKGPAYVWEVLHDQRISKGQW